MDQDELPRLQYDEAEQRFTNNVAIVLAPAQFISQEPSYRLHGQGVPQIENRLLQQEVEQWFVAELAEPDKSDLFRVADYSDGSGRAGRGLGAEATAIFLTVSQGLDFLTTWIDSGQLLIRFARWWKDRQIRAGYYNADFNRPRFSDKALVQICMGHAAATYGAILIATPVAFQRGEMRLFNRQWQNRARIIVNVFAEDGVYVYFLTGNASVDEHFKMNGTGVLPLDIPDWFEDSSEIARRSVTKLLDIQ